MTQQGKTPEPGASDGPYHHGKLREALLHAAEAELAEAGIEAFSLRKVARRAGVSHAAPAHHFGDVRGLLTALAASGYRQFLAMMVAEDQDEGASVEARILAAADGYIAFAEQHNALFRLIFSSERPDRDDEALQCDSAAAYMHLANLVEAATGKPPLEDPAALKQVTEIWAMVHGIADLLTSGRLMPLQSLGNADRRAMIHSMLARVLPG